MPWHSCFPVNFAKFLRTPFLEKTSGRLLLKKRPNDQESRFVMLNFHYHKNLDSFVTTDTPQKRSK